MKKLFFVFTSFIFLSANAQTADEIIQKYSDNLGGLEAFHKIKTAKITGTFSAQGTDLPLTIQIVNGKATRTDVDAMGSKIIRVYNDGKGWTQNPFGGATEPREATAAELSDFKLQSMLASPLMDYKTLGNQVELAGQEDVEGIKTFKIKMTSKEDGKVTNYYITTAEYVLLKSASDREIQGQKVTVETFYSDLKTINGVKFFMSKSQKINGEEFQHTTFTTVELDTPVDEKIFDMPK